MKMKTFFVIFSFFFFLVFSVLKSCICDDSIARRQSLRDGDVIFSKGKRFAFGFFSLGDSKVRYVGIWYAGISQQTIVWVANRDRPVNDTSGVMEFSSSGNLCLYASVNETEPLWSTNVSNSILKTKAIAVRLSDLGNLVLFDATTKRSLWESFDHPTDTWLPFMKFGFTSKDGLDRFLTSWRSPIDPGFGNITCRIDRRGGFPQMMMYKGVTLWWRMGSWTGQRWTGVPEMTNMFVNNQQDEVSSFTYSVTDASVITRMVVNETGNIQGFEWNARDKRWTDVWSVPKEQCDNYAQCGPNGYCNPTSSETFECICLPGFEPKMPRDWNLGDTLGGCTKKKNRASICREEQEFVKLNRVKVPDTSDASVDMNIITLKDCKESCLRNCSCVAYATAYHKGRNGATGCLTWHGGMMDIRTYFNSGQDFYIRVDKEELARWNGNGSSGNKKVLFIIIRVIAAGVLLTAILFFYLRKRRNSNRLRRSSTTFVPASFELEDSLRYEEDESRNLELPLFELSAIAAATNNFSFQNKLGSGGFGGVYKGVLQNGMEIAVKRLSKNSGQGMEEFKNEVKLISKLQHRNLVRILGCCVEMEEKMMIYEYLPNKSLDYFIFHEERRANLDWRKRMGIIRGIARGILYLHQDSRLRIIHRDLKASNILLDNEMIPKVADFGMARIFGGNQEEGRTNRVVGTYGYMSPEYAMDGQFSVKSDVYSFGVLMLEIITGNKNSAVYKESSNLVGHIWCLWEKGEATEIKDKLMHAETCEEREVMKCIHIGLLCVQESALDRPDMSSVVFMLGHNAIDLPSPKRPAFTVGRKRNVKNGGGSSSTWPSGETASSCNDITLTEVEGR